MEAAEAQMLSQCRAGDADAWDRLFDLHYQPTARFIWQVHSGFTPEDVEEICQETFLTVIRSLASFQGQSQLRTWICRVAANKAHDFRERQQAQKRGGRERIVSLDAEDPQTGLRLDPEGRGKRPDEELLSREANGLVSEALSSLGGPCQEILELRYFADLSYEEIAASLELNPKTVSSRLSKCLDKLDEVARPLFAGERKPTSSV